MASVIYTHVAAGISGAALAAVLAWQVQAWRYDAQIAGIRTEHAGVLQRAADLAAQAQARARETEQSMAREAEKIQGEHNEQVKDLAAAAADLRRRLRDASAAASGAGVPATAPAACPTGAPGGGDRPVVPAEIGIALVAEAERADAIRLQLATCERQYRAARGAVAGG